MCELLLLGGLWAADGPTTPVISKAGLVLLKWSDAAGRGHTGIPKEDEAQQ